MRKTEGINHKHSIEEADKSSNQQDGASPSVPQTLQTTWPLPVRTGLSIQVPALWRDGGKHASDS